VGARSSPKIFGTQGPSTSHHRRQGSSTSDESESVAWRYEVIVWVLILKVVMVNFHLSRLHWIISNQNIDRYVWYLDDGQEAQGHRSHWRFRGE
jgi:hypothetical protein